MPPYEVTRIFSIIAQFGDPDFTGLQPITLSQNSNLDYFYIVN